MAHNTLKMPILFNSSSSLGNPPREWLLGYFKDDGIEIIDNSEQQTQVYTDKYVNKNWRELAYEASGNPVQDDDEVLRDNYGTYLNTKHNF